MCCHRQYEIFVSEYLCEKFEYCNILSTFIGTIDSYRIRFSDPELYRIRI